MDHARKFTLWILGGAGVVAFAAGVFVGFRGCESNISQTPLIQSTSAPSAIASTKTDGLIKIGIKRPVYPPGVAPASGSTSQEALQGAFGGSQVSQHPPMFEEITIEAVTSAQAGATTSAPTIAGDRSPDHGRLGVIAGPFPGVFAADFQIARFDVPPWVAGMPLNVGVDVQANHLQAGAGLSAGGKLFVTGGAFSTWTLSQQGYYLGAGLRF